MVVVAGVYQRVTIIPCVMAESVEASEQGNQGPCPSCKTPFESSFRRRIRDVCGHEKCTMCLSKEYLKCTQCFEATGSRELWTPPDSPAKERAPVDGKHVHRFIELCVECFSTFNRGTHRRVRDSCGHSRCTSCVRNCLYCKQCIQQWSFVRYNQGRLVNGVVLLPCCDDMAVYDDIELGRGLEDVTLVNNEDIAKARDEKTDKIHAKQKKGEAYMQRAVDLVKEFQAEGKNEEALQKHMQEVTAMFFTGVFRSSEATKELKDMNEDLRKERDDLKQYFEDHNIPLPDKPEVKEQ